MAGKTLGGPERASAPAVIQRPDWVKKPTGDDMAWAYPEHASRLGIEGKAVIGCDVSVQGMLVDCKVVSEAPTGENFGEAALKLSKQFQMTPSNDPGHLPTITIPILFKLPPPEPLSTVASQGQVQASDWVAHHIKAPSFAVSVTVGLALGLIIVGAAISLSARRGAAGKDLSGPNGERR